VKKAGGLKDGDVAAELRRSDENRQQRRERKKRRATAVVLGVAKEFPGHSGLLP